MPTFSVALCYHPPEEASRHWERDPSEQGSACVPSVVVLGNRYTVNTFGACSTYQSLCYLLQGLFISHKTLTSSFTVQTFLNSSYVQAITLLGLKIQQWTKYSCWCYAWWHLVRCSRVNWLSTEDSTPFSECRGLLKVGKWLLRQGGYLPTPSPHHLGKTAYEFADKSVGRSVICSS